MNLIKVVSPEYFSEISSDTEIIIEAVDCGKVTATGVKNGKKAVLAEIDLSSDGRGSFIFKASEFPRGPVAVKFYAYDNSGAELDVCNLMLYNSCGIVSDGIKNAPVPPQIEGLGLKLLFADDFDSPELSVSDKSSDMRYYSHKPDFGDFSHLTFSDFNSDVNPFSQIDTYLKIRADSAKNSSGLISSLMPDGMGFQTKAPCYFECNFIAANSVGTWPAFWLLVSNLEKGRYREVDEIDTIEAYGLEDITHQNQRGYYVTAHRWNQGNPENTEPVTFIDMDKFCDGVRWDMASHTYGTLITESDTVYYCDNIEVYRHKTQPVSKTEPFFFMVNLAVGGNGWPVDLSRYGGIADMYVDYIRVYGK